MTKPTDSKDPQTLCDTCGEIAVRTERRMAEYTRGRTTVTYPEEISVCDNCGDTFFTRDQMESRSQSISAALLEAEENPFTPERIKKILAILKMKPAQFERAVGLGNKTVSRWERGTVPPSKAAQFTLWVAETFPNVIKAHAAAIGEADALVPEVAPRVATGSASSAPTARNHLRLLNPTQSSGTIDGKTGGRITATQPPKKSYEA